MRLIVRFICVMIIERMILSCSPALKVSSDYDKSIDFRQYKTYTIYKPENMTKTISELNEQRIVSAIRDEMLRKGFQETTDHPDLLINPVAVVQDKLEVSSATNLYSYGGPYRPYYWANTVGYSSSSYDIRKYKDGSLIIDVIEPSANKLLWQGVGDGEVDGQLKKPDEEIPKAVKSILAGFPPAPGKKS